MTSPQRKRTTDAQAEPHARMRTRTRATADEAGSSNSAQRQASALDLLSKGYGLAHITEACGFSSRFAARRALAAARKAIAEDTAEEHRLNFKASYGPVRITLHRLACMGDVRAAEALVKLDERECRLFGLDLTPDAAALNVQYTKRIVLEETVALVPAAPSPVESEGAA